MKIQDIAREVGVSTATISRVFSNHRGISEGTRDRVLEIAKQYGYHPKLSSRRRNVVVLTPSKIDFPSQKYTEMVVSELSRELSGRDYRVEVLPTDNFKRLESIQFCGVIAIGVDISIADKWDDQFAFPLIFVDRQLQETHNGVYSVHSDEYQGMSLAIDYLYQHGYRRIGCLIGSTETGNPEIRQQAIIRSLKEKGLPFDDHFIRFASPDQFIEEVGKLLRENIDSLFCPGGDAGIITAYALSLYGKRIPDDIALIASERSMVSRYCIPAQTTITQDYPALVKAVVDLIEGSVNQAKMPKSTVLPYKLISRDSVKRKK